MVHDITEYYDGKSVTSVDLVYDAEDELIYLYGARGEHSKYVRYEKTFHDVNILYKFLSELVANHDISLSVNYLTNLTNYDDYDSLRKRVDRNNEVVAYDNIKLSKRLLEKYVAAFF